MRHRQVIAVAMMALAGLAGCADRPNDLNTYYNGPPPSSSVPSQSRPSLSPPVATSPAGDVAALGHTVALAMLADTDLVEEGVQAGAADSETDECLRILPAVERPELGNAGSWLYPSGSSLKQRVAAYPGEQGAAVLTAVRCGGRTTSTPAVAGIDDQRAWCQASTCTVLVAKGHLVSGLQVIAGSGPRAVDAVNRLASILATKLISAQA